MATWQVGASSDDTYRRLSDNTWDLVATLVEVGSIATPNRLGAGMRFANITIPQGSVIDQAYLTLHSLSGAQLSTSVKSRISAENVDDAATFADDAAAFDTRWAARTTARVDWDDIPDWASETDYNSPEINTVIQEIVNRAGWVSGNDIVIFWDDFDDRTAHDIARRREAYSYDGTAAKAPKLVVTHTAFIPKVFIL